MFTTHSPDVLRTALLGACTLLLGACSGGASGPVITQQRGVDAFHSIDLRGAAKISVLVGPATSVVVTGPADALEKFDTRVQNGMLILESHRKLAWLGGNDANYELRITTPSLHAFAINGAGDVTINGVTGDALAIAVQGAGKLEASGEVKALNARINGAGDMDLSHLLASDASLVVNGAGNLTAQVTGSLDAKVNGVGNITYSGNPQKVDSSINGVGNISAAAK
jgi:hypothetical protein